jgi:hypothetical protein
MREDGPAERGAPDEPRVRRPAERIAHPYRDWAKQAASEAEQPRPEPSATATPVGEGRPKKRKWYSLYDKVFAPKNLQAAWERVQSNGGAPGCDGQTLAHFAAYAEANLQALHEQLRTKQYRPRPVKRVEIPKAGGGVRPLGIPCVRDRIVQQAVLQVLQPIFEPRFSCRSHGFRPERGTRSALEVADQALGVVKATLERLKLRLHPKKTRVVRLDEGFDFLGFHYFRDEQGRLQKKVSAKSKRRFREAIRKRTPRHAGQRRPKASRCTVARLQKNARVQRMIAEVNQFLRGWHGYFRKARTTYRDYLNDFDRIVRQRLRNAISGRCAQGRWNHILSNERFDAIGLLCLARQQRPCDLGPLTPPNSGYGGGSRVR